MCAIDCVLVGLDWVEPMMQFLLHVTCSCISHAYALYFSIYLLYLNCFRAFLIVSFFPLSILFMLVVIMAPNRKFILAWNPLHSSSSSSSDSAPLFLRFRDDDAHNAFSENFFRRGIHSELQVILAGFVDTDLPTVIHSRDGSHCVMSWSHVLLYLSRNFTPTCTRLIVQYLFSLLAFEIRTFLSHCNLLRICLGFLG